MELNKEFILKYNKLPVYWNINGTIKWEILKRDKKQIQYYFENTPENIDFLWQAILFSLYSQIIYTYSLENYKYIDDHLSVKYSSSNILQKISRKKLKYFIDQTCRKRFANSYNDFTNHSKKRMNDYVRFFIQISSHIDLPYCKINFNKLLLSIIEEKRFKEEFSDDENDLSNLFLQKLHENLLKNKILITGDFIFKELIPSNYTLYNYDDKKLPMDLMAKDINAYGVMYYPSAGLDINNLFYVNNQVIPEIHISTPHLYIHSDAFNYYKESNYFNDFKNEISKVFHFRVINETIYFNEDQTVIILMLQRPNSKEYTWLICFWGYENEKILKEMINKNIGTPIIYSNCDGITSGMGDVPHSIPTILYPLLNKDLGIKYIVTEQSWEKIKQYPTSQEWFCNLLINGLKSLKSVSKHNINLISKLLELKNDELLSTLEKILQIHTEEELPQIKYHRLLLKKIQSIDQ